VVAFDRTLDYRKLNTAYQALVHGARFFSTNADKICPMPGGGIPDAGATIAALEHITGRKVELVAGKPSMLMMQVASQRLGLEPGRILMVGDRLETDIFMGQQAGMQTAAVLSGVTRREDIAVIAHPPDYVFENLRELFDLLLSSSTHH
jgi:HAD superfamily hydrolase (TIGR01450 family)